MTRPRRPPVTNSEDTLVSAQTGNASGVVRTTAASFTNAGANSAQLFRIVLKADNNSAAADKRGRVYLAASGEYK